jgi:NRPS condensation-like uncharacterized protein
MKKGFQNKEELYNFILINIPVAVRPTKKAKTTFIYTFTSVNAQRIVVQELTDKIWEQINN